MVNKAFTPVKLNENKEFVSKKTEKLNQAYRLFRKEIILDVNGNNEEEKEDHKKDEKISQNGKITY